MARAWSQCEVISDGVLTRSWPTRLAAGIVTEPNHLAIGNKPLSCRRRQKSKEEVTFYDTVTGKPLFVAPRGRSWDEFLEESKHHGWPSFRDEELVTENVRVLANGEAVSADGTHLGHNIPDDTGNRYCINLVSVAGQAAKDEL